MRKIISWLIVLPALALPGWVLMRFVQVWRTSPLDRHDQWYILVAVLAAVWPAVHAAREKMECDWRALPFLSGMLAVLAAGWTFSINLVLFAGAEGTLFGLIWLLFGWRCFWRLLPAGAILFLCVPTTNQMGVIPALGMYPWLKPAICAAVLVYEAVSETLEWCPTREGGWFRLACLLFLICAAGNVSVNSSGDPLQLDLTQDELSGYVGTELPLSALDKNFFSGMSEVSRRLYSGVDNESISLLAMKTGTSIHNVHPPATCLMSSGWQVKEQALCEWKHDGAVLAYERLLIRKQGRDFVMLTWYSGKNGSTGSFVRFRHLWRKESPWQVYQIMSPIFAEETPEKVEKRIFAFIFDIQRVCVGAAYKE